MSFVKLNNLNCYYELHNFGHEETIIFSNSLGTNLSIWEKTLDVLSHHVNVLLYDTRGHGRSEAPKKDITLADLGNDVLDLIDHLKISQPCFCGLSLGGLIGQWLGINAHSQFKKLILSNTSARIATVESWNQRIENVSKNGLASITEATANRWFTSEFIDYSREIVEKILKDFVSTNLESYIMGCKVVRDNDLREHLFEIEIPVLIICGSKDMVTTVSEGKFMQKRIPVCSNVSLNAAHLSCVELPEEFSKHILHFLNQH